MPFEINLAGASPSPNAPSTVAARMALPQPQTAPPAAHYPPQPVPVRPPAVAIPAAPEANMFDDAEEQADADPWDANVQTPQMAWNNPSPQPAAPVAPVIPNVGFSNAPATPHPPYQPHPSAVVVPPQPQQVPLTRPVLNPNIKTVTMEIGGTIPTQSYGNIKLSVGGTVQLGENPQKDVNDLRGYLEQLLAYEAGQLRKLTEAL